MKYSMVVPGYTAILLNYVLDKYEYDVLLLYANFLTKWNRTYIYHMLAS